MPDQTPVDKKRFGFLALAAAVLAALLIGALLFANRDGRRCDGTIGRYGHGDCDNAGEPVAE